METICQQAKQSGAVSSSSFELLMCEQYTWQEPCVAGSVSVLQIATRLEPSICLYLLAHLTDEVKHLTSDPAISPQQDGGASVLHA